MDEMESDGVMTVAQRLREARETLGLSIEDIAAQTRIPTRHLASLEAGEWSKLPAATYSVGFAKSYAAAVGLDRSEIGDQLRAEMGGVGPVTAAPEVFEAADPARTMPKGLVFGALAVLLLVVLGLTWLNNRSLRPDEAATPPANEPAIAGNGAAPVAEPVAAGPVVLTANDAVWIEVKDGEVVLKQGELAAGQSYEVPANAAAPLLTTGKPEALRISVGTANAPPIGPAGQRVSGVSLRAKDLMQPASATDGPAAAPVPASE
ncbi:helix-turn-helix domain-containing protein [Sphingomonas xanthus]|uniref:Helix-turn-helix domain-containing protein n=1 Tax=Sphingomonas xanthus TaxID=2594473 RepID=A0A516IQP9_9SPHN|nr:helix-turn-helix domain-containing protein [Sphingomonas xanthus]QDP19243.1 helix-turn-helix domain-containing protein [Sphingomonas xanthus]